MVCSAQVASLAVLAVPQSSRDPSSASPGHAARPGLPRSQAGTFFAEVSRTKVGWTAPLHCDSSAVSLPTDRREDQSLSRASQVQAQCACSGDIRSRLHLLR